MTTFTHTQIKAAHEAITAKIESLTEAMYSMKGQEKRETRRDIRCMQTIEASLARALPASGDYEFNCGQVIDFIEYVNGQAKAAVKIADGSLAEAFYNQNTVAELREIADGEPDEAGMAVWGLSDTEWHDAVCDALEAKKLEI